MKKRLSLLFVLLLVLTACSSDKTQKETDSGGMSKQREPTKEDKEYIQLLNNKQYDKIIEKTEKLSSDNPLKDYHYMATAFKKEIEAKEYEENLSKDDYNYQGVALKYIDVMNKIREIKFIPNEYKEKVNNLLEIASEKKEYYSKLRDEKSRKINEKIKDYDDKRQIDYRTQNPQYVRIGMTKQDVLTEGWGRPEDINKTITPDGTSEQWVYSNYKYLYFEDGILKTIQD